MYWERRDRKSFVLYQLVVIVFLRYVNSTFHPVRHICSNYLYLYYSVDLNILCSRYSLSTVSRVFSVGLGLIISHVDVLQRVRFIVYFLLIVILGLLSV